MTQELERNYEYLQKSLTRAGFGYLYNEQLKADMEAGKRGIDLPFTEQSLGAKDYILFRPTIVEKEDRPGFYIFTEISATKFVNERPEVSVAVPHFKMTGMTVAQITTVLNGGTVLHTEGEDAANKAKQYFSSIDLSKPVKIGENREIIRVPANKFDLPQLLSKERYMGKGDEKEQVLLNIQNGLKADVTLQRPDEYGKYPKVTLQLALLENNEKNGYDLALKVLDRSGKELNIHRQEPKEDQGMKTTLRLQAAKKPDGLPDSTLMLTEPGGAAGKQTPKKSKTP